MAALRSALLVAVAVGAASGQELEDALRRQCAAALTQNFCALAFGTSPICVWTASSAGDAACQLPMLEGGHQSVPRSPLRFGQVVIQFPWLAALQKGGVGHAQHSC